MTLSWWPTSRTSHTTAIRSASRVTQGGTWVSTAIGLDTAVTSGITRATARMRGLAGATAWALKAVSALGPIARSSFGRGDADGGMQAGLGRPGPDQQWPRQPRTRHMALREGSWDCSRGNGMERQALCPVRATAAGG